MPSDLIQGWVPVRVEKTRQNKELESPFRFNRNGKGSSDQLLILRSSFGGAASTLHMPTSVYR
jgi:hypothetical protein